MCTLFSCYLDNNNLKSIFIIDIKSFFFFLTFPFIYNKLIKLANYYQLSLQQTTFFCQSTSKYVLFYITINFCFFCNEFVLNFARHIQRNHSSEIEVQRISSFKLNSKERKLHLSNLRKKGNFLTSRDVPKAVRKPGVENQLRPCDFCVGLYSKRQLWRHKQKCKISHSKKINVQNVLLNGLKIDQELINSVFPKMRNDEVSMIAQRDILICAFAARYMKLHREKHFINVTYRKMRELAKLLMEMKKIELSITCLLDALRPKHFDCMIAATKIVAKYDEKEGIYEAPTYAMNIATTLTQCCDIAIVRTLKRKEIYSSLTAAEFEAELKSTIHLIKTQWRFEVSSQALNNLNINKWNKVTLIPLASDLKLLKDFLITKAEKAVSSLQNSDSIQQYKILLESVFCRVMLLNRRRPGELQRITLNRYEKIDNSNTYEEFNEVVSPSEKILLQKFKRIVIRGKRGRGVPVLFSCYVQEHIDILLKYRTKYTKEDNIYLFGNTTSSEPITDDIEQLANFMGHTVGVHRGLYRLPDDVYQTAKISKVLLLMEEGRAGQYKGKPSNEIELNLEDDLITEIETTTNHNNEIELELLFPERQNMNPSLNKDDESNMPPLTKKSKRQLVSWTEDQKRIVKNYFVSHIRNNKPPKRHECEKLKEQYTDLLQNKDWLKIKVFIQNRYTKKK
ncbi:hypothetical protein ABEB36_014538 [Hypothenemus hampei]|uniref:Uncharacterized protein n=1 Tax=Hypothenemus hampei TaxID=57062 RepID=A0ABD1E232_HYPHA